MQTSIQVIHEIWMLHLEGYKKREIAKRLGVSGATVKKYIEQMSEALGVLPQGISVETMIGRLQHLINIKIRDTLLGEQEDGLDTTMQIYKMTNTLKNLEEINEAVSLRDRVEVSREIMEWMIRRRYSGTLDQLQEYHDEHLAYL